MNDQELRTMIRDSIAKHLGTVEPGALPLPAMNAPGVHLHASHGTLPLARGSDEDGACLIEPSVRCNHCGYCVSYGH
jgi:hypothetical protein